jgi:ABC-type Fe3+-hydroxamate transport system substrate-binding protein
VEPADAVADIATVGGTKNIDVDAIVELEPDLILANKEENSRSALEKLAQQQLRVFVSFPRRVGDALAHLARLARVFEVEKEPKVVELTRRAYRAGKRESPATRLSAFVPIWLDPLMTIGGDTYASDLLAAVGFRNVFEDRRRLYPLAADHGEAEPEDPGDRDDRYPRITEDELIAAKPELVLLPDEPYKFTEADAERYRALDIPAVVHFVSGKDLFWPGVRTLDALERLSGLITDNR